jgi:hypothetical protein
VQSSGRGVSASSGRGERVARSGRVAVWGVCGDGGCGARAARDERAHTAGKAALFLHNFKNNACRHVSAHEMVMEIESQSEVQSRLSSRFCIFDFITLRATRFRRFR